VASYRPSAELPRHLEALYAGFAFHRSYDADPISEVRPLARDLRSAEVAGIFASTLAIGNTTAIRGAIVRLAGLADGDAGRLVDPAWAGERRRRLRGFRHRWIRGDQLDRLAENLGAYYRTHVSLETAFLEGLERGGFAHGIDRLSHVLRGDGRREGPARGVPRGFDALFPSPLEDGRSAAKRLTLFVRWMVRPRYPDLGVWNRVPTGELKVPLDHHVHWIAYHLGLTARRSRSWAAVEDVSEALRRIDPLDPVRFDFVLCHTGVSGDCPKERDLSVCGPCAVRPDCRLWNGRGRPT
jgi:uncharacterized protein (TIGR02757 family)